MCGRFSLTRVDDVEEFFELDERPELEVRYNIAPSQQVVTVVADCHGHRSGRRMEWGLIPHWSQGSSPSRWINARSETVARKASFKESFESRRCLVPADGFFEWRRKAGFKEPFYFSLRNRALFAFAGVWDVWAAPQRDPVQTFTILTTRPNSLIDEIHDRMPVILGQESYAVWLSRESKRSSLLDLLRPYPAQAMETTAVNAAVNKGSVDSPLCIQPAVPRLRTGNLFE